MDQPHALRRPLQPHAELLRALDSRLRTGARLMRASASCSAPFPSAVKPAIMDGTYRFPSTDGSGRNRENQEQAFALLTGGRLRAEGRQARRCGRRPARVRDPRGLDLAGGAAAELARDVERLGIEVKLRVVDGAQYQARLNELRLRHDPEHVAVVAVARQRAAVPLVDGRGEDDPAPTISPASRTRRPTP